MTSPALLQVAVGGDRPYSITIGAVRRQTASRWPRMCVAATCFCSATAKWPRAIWMP